MRKAVLYLIQRLIQLHCKPCGEYNCCDGEHASSDFWAESVDSRAGWSELRCAFKEKRENRRKKVKRARIHPGWPIPSLLNFFHQRQCVKPVENFPNLL